jgi:hypothetical protein
MVVFPINCQVGDLINWHVWHHKVERTEQPNFQYGKSIFGRIGSSKKAAQKTPIMNSEQLFRAFFSCFHGQKFNFLDFFTF